MDDLERLVAAKYEISHPDPPNWLTPAVFKLLTGPQPYLNYWYNPTAWLTVVGVPYVRRPRHTLEIDRRGALTMPLAVEHGGGIVGPVEHWAMWHGRFPIADGWGAHESP